MQVLYYLCTYCAFIAECFVQVSGTRKSWSPLLFIVRSFQLKVNTRRNTEQLHSTLYYFHKINEFRQGVMWGGGGRGWLTAMDTGTRAKSVSFISMRYRPRAAEGSLEK